MWLDPIRPQYPMGLRQCCVWVCSRIRNPTFLRISKFWRMTGRVVCGDESVSAENRKRFYNGTHVGLNIDRVSLNAISSVQCKKLNVYHSDRFDAIHVHTCLSTISLLCSMW